MSERKAYIGDAVYAEINNGELVLTTEDGIRATNTIILEPEVLSTLMLYLGAAKERTFSRACLRVADDTIDCGPIYHLDECPLYPKFARTAEVADARASGESNDRLGPCMGNRKSHDTVDCGPVYHLDECPLYPKFEKRQP